MYTFVALLAFVVVVNARQSTDQPCETPKQWEADETIEIDALNRTTLYKASCDAINKQVRGLVQYDPEGHEYIVHYNEHRMYSIVRKTGKCTVSRYDEPFVPAEIPQGAKYVGNGFVGLKNTGARFKIYNGTFERMGSKGFAVISVLEENCILMYSKSVLKGITSRVSVYNVELGIKDPSVFIPPKSCEEVPVPDVV